METRTVGDVIECLKAEYLTHFHTPHSNKAYTEQGKAIKALITAVGSENILLTFKFLLECKDPWLQNAKNVGGLIKWYDAIQTMRLNTRLVTKTGSYSEDTRLREAREKDRLEAFRKEMLDD